jgi:hypothetical protein
MIILWNTEESSKKAILMHILFLCSYVTELRIPIAYPKSRTSETEVHA